MIRITLLSLFVLLTACTTVSVSETPLDRGQLIGSKLKLTRTLTIPGGSAGVTLQFGEPVKPNDINRYYPHCRLEVTDVHDTNQTVQPDEFQVHRMYQLEQTASHAGLLRVQRLYSANSVSFIVFRTILELTSPNQTQVRSLICQHWADPASGRHLSLNEIHKALGTVMILTMPGRASL